MDQVKGEEIRREVVPVVQPGEVVEEGIVEVRLAPSGQQRKQEQARIESVDAHDVHHNFQYNSHHPEAQTYA